MRFTPASSARLVLPLLLAAAPLAAADGLTSSDVARLRSVAAVAISPDGSRIAYLLSVPRKPLEAEEDGPAWAELHVVGRDGVSRAFVTGPVVVGEIAWTRDGRRISFLAKRGKDEHRSLYVIPADGGEARRVLTHEADISGYAWGPDGRRVAFLAAEEPSKAGKDLEKQGFNQQVYEESARPVGIWVAEPETSGAKPRRLEVKGSTPELKWAPVGSLLAAAVAPTPLVDDSLMGRRVTVVDADSGKVVGRVENPGKLGAIAWSPDGKTLAYAAGA